MSFRHLFFSLPLMVLGFEPAACAVENFDPSRLEKEILVSGCTDAVQLECLPDGRILFVEFWGTVKMWDPGTNLVSTLGTIPTHAKGEVGLLGFAASRDFVRSGHLYALFCPSAKSGSMRVSRFTVRDDKLDPESERALLEWDYDTEHVYHMGGAMWMDARGDLYIGNGDNCHWNPGLPVDARPGKRSWDAQRSAANSRDFRGKILRIHPDPEGGYSIPGGNLFPDGKEGAPEVYCMGIRNPYRISVDDRTGSLYIGDVGPNVLPELGVTPAGYEEINVTRTAANFGWPYFVGPNEALPLFDFDAGKEIRRQSPDSPRNDSPNNTGAKLLPPAKPALIWYSSVASKRFPTVGSGGRSVMAGPVYRFDSTRPPGVCLPEIFDGKLFVYEWMRNWIQTVDSSAREPSMEPFLAGRALRRPIDLKFGPDGALYMIEYGDQWWNNTDSQISRIIYRRGNRSPVAALRLDETAGQAPFTLKADASGSTDPDQQPVTYSWSIDGKSLAKTGASIEETLQDIGTHEIALTVTDSAGGSSTRKEFVHVGNSRPQVAIEAPAHGSFFDWEQDISFSLRITEADGDQVREAEASIQGEFRSRRFSADGIEAVDPGLSAMRASTCFSCHTEHAASAGPPFRQIALKYRDDAEAAQRLTTKIIGGGAGVWGALPMPPHPQHTAAQVRGMVDWVLSLKAVDSLLAKTGVQGQLKAPKKPGGDSRTGEGVLLLKASYSDDGRGGTLPRLRGEKTVVLHSRKKKAALCDENHGMAAVEQVEGETGLVGRFSDGAYILFKDINLTGITRLAARAGSFKKSPSRLELRKGGPRGDLIAVFALPETGEDKFAEVAVTVQDAGLVDLCVLAKCEGDGEAGLNWIEFR